MVYSTCSNSSSNGSKVEHLLKSICELAADLDGIERRYVKKGQRLLFCGPDLMSLVSKCTEIRVAFDAFHGEFMVYFDIYIYIYLSIFPSGEESNFWLVYILKLGTSYFSYNRKRSRESKVMHIHVLSVEFEINFSKVLVLNIYSPVKEIFLRVVCRQYNIHVNIQRSRVLA